MSLSKQEKAALFERYKAGDVDAPERLWEILYPELKRQVTAFVLTKRPKSHDLDEIVADLLVLTYEVLSNRKKETSSYEHAFRQALYILKENVWKDYIEKRQAQKRGVNYRIESSTRDNGEDTLSTRQKWRTPTRPINQPAPSDIDKLLSWLRTHLTENKTGSELWKDPKWIEACEQVENDERLSQHVKDLLCRGLAGHEPGTWGEEVWKPLSKFLNAGDHELWGVLKNRWDHPLVRARLEDMIFEKILARGPTLRRETDSKQQKKRKTLLREVFRDCLEDGLNPISRDNFVAACANACRHVIVQSVLDKYDEFRVRPLMQQWIGEGIDDGSRMEMIFALSQAFDALEKEDSLICFLFEETYFMGKAQKELVERYGIPRSEMSRMINKGKEIIKTQNPKLLGLLNELV